MAEMRIGEERFAHYPPQAKKVAISHLSLLRRLPPSFLPSLLREVIEYDYKFPAELARIDQELAILSSLSPDELSEWFLSFSKIKLSPLMEKADWVERPGQFTDQVSAYLWSTHQMDAFRAAAKDYGSRLQAKVSLKPLMINRLGVAVIGQGVQNYDAPLFRRLREHGTYFGNIDPSNGWNTLREVVSTRAEKYQAQYAHWYVDGGKQDVCGSRVTSIAFGALETCRAALLKKIEDEAGKAGMGPEDLHRHLVELSPKDLGLNREPLLDRFQVNILTEGSGTQIFSTTFAQWTAREVLRRAEPLTLLVRFAPRQRERPMSELLSGRPAKLEMDPVGSLIDADMAAYYHWINQQRLPGSDQSSFIAWFENHEQAVAVGPSFPRGVESKSRIDIKGLLALVSG